MRKRLSVLIVSAVAIGALAGLPAGASAKHGADDPVGHVRHSQGADDNVSKTTAKRRAHRRARHHRRHGRGADDAVGHIRHGRGLDDGPNHT